MHITKPLHLLRFVDDIHCLSFSFDSWFREGTLILCYCFSRPNAVTPSHFPRIINYFIMRWDITYYHRRGEICVFVIRVGYRFVWGSGNKHEQVPPPLYRQMYFWEMFFKSVWGPLKETLSKLKTKFLSDGANRIAGITPNFPRRDSFSVFKNAATFLLCSFIQGESLNLGDMSPDNYYYRLENNRDRCWSSRQSNAQLSMDIVFVRRIKFWLIFYKAFYLKNILNFNNQKHLKWIF